MGPTFHFNVPALHFGDVSFGECALGSHPSVSALCVAGTEHLNIIPPPQPLQGVNPKAAGASDTLLPS